MHTHKRWFQLVSVCLGLKSGRFTQGQVKANRLPRLHRDPRGFSHNAPCPRAALTRSGTADPQHSEPRHAGHSQHGTQNQRTNGEPQKKNITYIICFYHESKIYDWLDMIKTHKQKAYVTITTRKTDYNHHRIVFMNTTGLKDISWRYEKTCGFDSKHHQIRSTVILLLAIISYLRFFQSITFTIVL